MAQSLHNNYLTKPLQSKKYHSRHTDPAQEQISKSSTRPQLRYYTQPLPAPSHSQIPFRSLLITRTVLLHLDGISLRRQPPRKRSQLQLSNPLTVAPPTHICSHLPSRQRYHPQRHQTG